MVLLCCRACNPSKLQIRRIWLSSHSGRKNQWVYETLNSDPQKIKDLVLIHNHGSRKTKGINQRNLDPESRFLWNLKKNKLWNEGYKQQNQRTTQQCKAAIQWNPSSIWIENFFTWPSNSMSCEVKPQRWLYTLLREENDSTCVKKTWTLCDWAIIRL